MQNRRKFIRNSALGAAVIGANPLGVNVASASSAMATVKPVVISTWSFGMKANAAAWEILNKGGRALDAVEAGVMVPEADPAEQSVGYGGIPDRDGNVTLDSCIMNEKGEAGSVAFLQHIMHPVSVARMVMEKTPHVMLVGAGALKFAVDNGFKEMDLLTPESKAKWQEWLKTSKYEPVINWEEHHDTIGMVAVDSLGNLSGACTTSGLGFKMFGRVGDSPIIGAGLYVDNEVGGATSTGVGEAVIKTCGSFLIVEMMRQGKSPQEACEIAVNRIMKKIPNYRDIQVGFLAVNKNGEHGAYALQKGFVFARQDNSGANLNNADYLLK